MNLDQFHSKYDLLLIRNRLSLGMWNFKQRCIGTCSTVGTKIDCFCVTRFHKGQTVTGSRFQSTVTRESTTDVYYMSRLTIVSTEAGDEGEYKAVAKNEHGEVTAIVNLNFEGGGKFKLA